MPVIELQSRRTPDFSIILTGLGFERPAEWKLLGHLSPQYSYRGVIAAPSVAGLHRGSATARFVQIAIEDPGSPLSARKTIAARFHAYVASRALIDCGSLIRTAEVSVVFHDGSLIDVEPLDMRLGQRDFDALIEDVDKKPHITSISADKLVPRLVRQQQAKAVGAGRLH